YEWIKKGQYNFRMGAGRGSLVLNKEMVFAKYLLLHTHGNKSSSELWRIISPGPKVLSRLDLENKGYPKAKRSEDYKKNYLVSDIEPADEIEFEGIKWNFKELKNYKSGRASALPFTATLSELMKNIAASSKSI